MSFSDEERAYIAGQSLARIATVSPDGQPDATPVTFDFDGADFYIGGYDPGNTRRARNVRAGQHKVALIIDDLLTRQPWTPRFLRVHGTAELVDRGGQDVLKVSPVTSWSMNLSGAWSPGSHVDNPTRRTDHTGG